MGTWAVVAIILVLFTLLVVFLVMKNRKDEKQFEEQLNQDYHKPKPSDVETEGTDSI